MNCGKRYSSVSLMNDMYCITTAIMRRYLGCFVADKIYSKRLTFRWNSVTLGHTYRRLQVSASVWFHFSAGRCVCSRAKVANNCNEFIATKMNGHQRPNSPLALLVMTSEELSQTKKRKPSCRWQTRATLAKSLHGLRKSSGVVSCIASLPIDSVPT